MGHLGSRAFAGKHSRRVTIQFFHRNIKTHLYFYNFYIFCFYISMILSNMVILFISECESCDFKMQKNLCLKITIWEGFTALLLLSTSHILFVQAKRQKLRGVFCFTRQNYLENRCSMEFLKTARSYENIFLHDYEYGNK